MKSRILVLFSIRLFHGRRQEIANTSSGSQPQGPRRVDHKRPPQTLDFLGFDTVKKHVAKVFDVTPSWTLFCAIKGGTTSEAFAGLPGGPPQQVSWSIRVPPGHANQLILEAFGPHEPPRDKTRPGRARPDPARPGQTRQGWARPGQTEVMKSRILLLFWHPTLPHETTRNRQY